MVGLGGGSRDVLQLQYRLSSREKCIITMNEMHLREDLAYDKHKGNVNYTFICNYVMY